MYMYSLFDSSPFILLKVLDIFHSAQTLIMYFEHFREKQKWCNIDRFVLSINYVKAINGKSMCVSVLDLAPVVL